MTRAPLFPTWNIFFFFEFLAFSEIFVFTRQASLGEGCETFPPSPFSRARGLHINLPISRYLPISPHISLMACHEE